MNLGKLLSYRSFATACYCTKYCGTKFRQTPHFTSNLGSQPQTTPGQQRILGVTSSRVKTSFSCPVLQGRSTIWAFLAEFLSHSTGSVGTCDACQLLDDSGTVSRPTHPSGLWLLCGHLRPWPGLALVQRSPFSVNINWALLCTPIFQHGLRGQWAQMT